LLRGQIAAGVIRERTERADRRHVDARREQCRRQRIAERNRFERCGWFRALRVLAIEIAAEPAVLLGAHRRRGFPDLRRFEVREVGIGIAHALQERDVAFLIEFIQAGERRVPADAIVQLQHGLRIDADRRPRFVIRIVRVRNHRVEPVIAAIELHDHQDVVRIDARAERGRTLRVCRAHERERHRAAERGCAQGAGQERCPFHVRLAINSIG
jgi:hypothetical protein